MCGGRLTIFLALRVTSEFPTRRGDQWKVFFVSFQCRKLLLRNIFEFRNEKFNIPQTRWKIFYIRFLENTTFRLVEFWVSSGCRLKRCVTSIDVIEEIERGWLPKELSQPRPFAYVQKTSPNVFVCIIGRNNTDSSYHSNVVLHIIIFVCSPALPVLVII